ncbi:MAG: glycosyltransferase family 4 protein [Cyanobacteria bacterium K_Offshore_0m_m2_072]|nr:glycosyltransferase family 4 protein [Cyanobacteria bacterium K_Offshore_0m_m2_072]
MTFTGTVLLLNHADAAGFQGGDGLQMQQTALWLRRWGVEVGLQNSDQPDLAGVDLVHVFNCRHLHHFAPQVRAIAEAGIPFVVSPIWIPLAEALWGSRCAEAVLKAIVAQPAEAAAMLHKLKRRAFTVVLEGQGCTYPWGYPALQERQAEIADLLNQASGLVVNSWLELQAVRRDLRWFQAPVAVAPYGVDPAAFLNADPQVFRQWSGIDGPFVLQAGRIEPAKNQAMLLYALRHDSLPVVLAGTDANSPEYGQLCRQIGGQRVHIVGHLPPHLLASAYAAAQAHVLPSWCETCGLVSLEAALSGTPVVASTVGHEAEYLRGDAWYADPGDPEALRRAVLEAVAAGREAERCRRLRRRVLAECSWERMGEATLALYAQVVGL